VRRGLAPRVLLAGAGVVALLLAEFAVLGASFVTVGHTTHDEQRAAQSIAAATRLEKLLLDLETGARGYVITHDQHFLQPWRRAQTRLPAVSAELIRLDPGPRTSTATRSRSSPRRRATRRPRARAWRRGTASASSTTSGR
jgi:CHASE3 domain sensor protein